MTEQKPNIKNKMNSLMDSISADKEKRQRRANKDLKSSTIKKMIIILVPSLLVVIVLVIGVTKLFLTTQYERCYYDCVSDSKEITQQRDCQFKCRQLYPEEK